MGISQLYFDLLRASTEGSNVKAQTGGGHALWQRLEWCGLKQRKLRNGCSHWKLEEERRLFPRTFRGGPALLMKPWAWTSGLQNSERIQTTQLVGICQGSPRKVLSLFSHARLFATLWPIAHQDPLSMGFFKKSTGVGCHALLQGIFPTQGLNPRLLCLLPWPGVFFTTSCTWEA